MHKFEHTVARVAVWNLAGFGGIPDARRDKQVEGLALLDAELVTLVEVNPVNYLDDLRAGLAALGVNYSATLLPQGGSLHIGFLHKDGVEITNPRFVPNSNGTYVNGRLAVAVDVKIGNFRAILIGVHLKSGRGHTEQLIRDSQCEVIADYIKAQRELPGMSHRTILLMGDFNMIPGQDVSNFHRLGGDDMMDFVSCWDLQDRFSHILKKGRANLLDGFAVSRTWSTDYIRGSLRLFPMHWTMDLGRERFKDDVSDHLPFVASFRIH
ncbi:MAG: endonuclease/exonuclease/phosphatase family protein [Paracoccaceae bacterium]